MKKISVFFVALFLAFSVPTIPMVPAQMSVPASAPVSAVPAAVPMPAAVVPPALDRIGVVAAAGGKVELTTFGQAGRTAQSGQPIFMGDEVKTDAAGHLQILLLDETVFTIGPNSTITIDKFVYDPKSHNGEIRASITQGVFRYVSGKIAAKNPDSVKVKLPTASLGFRGTIVGGSVGANGQGLAALLGPGNNNDTGARTGSFTIDGDSGDHQDVNRTGFGVEVGADGGVSDVFQLSDAQINGLTQGLGGGQGGGGGGGEGDGEGGGLGGDTDMGSLSGEDGAIAGDNVSFTDGLSGISESMNAASTLGAQEARNASGETSTTSKITTLAQLASITSGSYHYSFSNQAFTQTLPSNKASTGVFSGSFDADFSAQEINNILITINTGSPFPGSITITNVSLTNQLFTTGSGGEAVFSTSGTDMTASITLENSDGDIAHNAQVAVTYNKVSTGDVGSGTATISGHT